MREFDAVLMLSLMLALGFMSSRTALASGPLSTACGLASAQDLSGSLAPYDGGTALQPMTTAGSPESLCQYYSPHTPGLIVILMLFTAQTLRDPRAASVTASAGCRTAACKKALADDSPAELYAAQTGGAGYHCQFSSAIRCRESASKVLWAIRNGAAVAIIVVPVREPGAQSMPNPLLETLVLEDVCRTWGTGC